MVVSKKVKLKDCLSKYKARSKKSLVAIRVKHERMIVKIISEKIKSFMCCFDIFVFLFKIHILLMLNFAQRRGRKAVLPLLNLHLNLLQEEDIPYLIAG